MVDGGELIKRQGCRLSLAEFQNFADQIEDASRESKYYLKFDALVSVHESPARNRTFSFGGDTGNSCFLLSFFNKSTSTDSTSRRRCHIAFQQSLDCMQLVIDYLTSSSFVSVKKVGQFPRQHRHMSSLARRLFYPSASSTLPARARPRLSLLQRHLDSSPFELNTPFSIERASELEIDVNHIRPPFQQQQQQVRKISSATRQQKEQQKENPLKMSSQPPHPALMIPGPIELDDAVLQAMSHYRLGYSSIRYAARANN